MTTAVDTTYPRGPWRSGQRAGRPRAIPLDEIEVRPRHALRLIRRVNVTTVTARHCSGMLAYLVPCMVPLVCRGRATR